MTGWTFSIRYRFRIFGSIIAGPGYEYQLAYILFTAQCTLVFVTAVNEFEFCKTLKSKLSQEFRGCNDGHLTIVNKQTKYKK